VTLSSNRRIHFCFPGKEIQDLQDRHDATAYIVAPPDEDGEDDSDHDEG
jgi:hypothetical protein